MVAALEDEAFLIVAAQKLLESSEVRNDLTFIVAEFGFLPQVICQLQERGEPLPKLVKIVDDAVQRLESVPGKWGLLVREKCKMVFSKNPDLDKLRNIKKVLQGDNSVVVELVPTVVQCIRFAPITSVDVERSFSQMKNVLSDRSRVAIRLGFPGRVLFFRVKNSVRPNFLNLAKCPGFLINDRLSLFPINSMLS